MQKESLIKKEESEIQPKAKGGIFSQIDLDTKREIAKIGMTASMGITVVTSFYMKNKFMKNLHIGAGVALVGFSFWHHMLYQANERLPKLNPPKKPILEDKENESLEEIKTENYAISLNNFFIELSITGRLTHLELKKFTEKIEALLEMYKIPSINILLDITPIEGIELKALYEEIVFTIKHLDSIKKVAILGDNKIEEYATLTANQFLKTELAYFKNHNEAHNWLVKEESFQDYDN